MAKNSSPIDVVDRRHPSESALIDERTLDPTKEYRFVQERPTSVARARLKGYRVVRPSEDKVKTLYDQEDKPAEDIIKHGDRILMAVPKAKHRQFTAERKARAISRLQSADRKAKELAKERGVKLHEKYEDKEDD